MGYLNLEAGKLRELAGWKACATALSNTPLTPFRSARRRTGHAGRVRSPIPIPVPFLSTYQPPFLKSSFCRCFVSVSSVCSCSIASFRLSRPFKIEIKDRFCIGYEKWLGHLRRLLSIEGLVSRIQLRIISLKAETNYEKGIAANFAHTGSFGIGSHIEGSKRDVFVQFEPNRRSFSAGIGAESISGSAVHYGWQSCNVQFRHG